MTDLNNIRYLSGFTGSSAYVIITGTKSWFLTDSRYTAQAAVEVKGFVRKTYRKALEEVTGLLNDLKLRKVGFEGDRMSYDAFLRFKKALPGIKLMPTRGMAARLRARKDAFEIDRVKDSVKVLELGFGKAEESLVAGAAEKDAASAIEFNLRQNGADGLAFDAIIASGYRGAMPHGKASDKKIRKGELIIVDMGVCLNGYNSDETRTYCVGRATRLQKEVYDTVLEAQRRAIEKIRPGVSAAAVDLEARSFIDNAGYGKYFGHGTGHGVGLEVHENPYIGPYSKDVLEEGMIVTIEPGIYIPSFGGVRIEDMALVVKGGCEILTKTPRKFTCL